MNFKQKKKEYFCFFLQFYTKALSEVPTYRVLHHRTEKLLYKFQNRLRFCTYYSS